MVTPSGGFDFRFCPPLFGDPRECSKPPLITRCATCHMAKNAVFWPKSTFSIVFWCFLVFFGVFLVFFWCFLVFFVVF